MSARLLTSLASAEFKAFVNSFDTVLSDCDGVLWEGENIINGSPEVIQRLVALGKKVFYVTNNSTKSREEYVNKCKLLGYPAQGETDIMSTSYLAASYLADKGFRKKVYILGSTGISRELDRLGIQHIGIGADPMEGPLVSYLHRLGQLDKDVGAVVVGFDEHFSYPKLLKASSYLRNPTCMFIATNTDELFPTPMDLIVPGTGTIVAAVKTATEREPVVLGKPSTYVFESIRKTYAVNPQRTIMIGDRAQSDILLGKNCGLKTLLVLSGVSSKEDLEEWKSSRDPALQKLVPDFYAEKMGDLLPMLDAME